MPHRWSLVALHALLDRGLDNPVRDANTLCYDLLMHWPSLWTFVTTPGVELSIYGCKCTGRLRPKCTSDVRDEARVLPEGIVVATLKYRPPNAPVRLGA